MSYGQHMVDLQEICIQVWQVNNLEDKRNLLRRAVSTFKYKAKAEEFLQVIAKADASKCDMLARDLILNKEHKVVKPLPR